MLTRTDIDGTVPGVAVSTIVSLDPEADRLLISVDRYVETDFPDPQLTAESIWASVKDDWPGCAHTVALNDRARYLMARRRVERLIGADYGIDEYLEDKNDRG